MSDDVRELLRVPAGETPDLDARDAADLLHYRTVDTARQQLDGFVARLADLQRRLEAEEEQALLVLLQGMDSAGKDEVISQALRGLNPQQYRVEDFSEPSDEDLAHDFLWRFHAPLPQRGEIGVHNRSWYEAVLTERVHDHVPEERWRARYGHIRNFEEMLADEGTRVVKFFLHLSPDVQRQRLQARIDDPERNWEFDESDLVDRAHWDDFMAAYEDALRETSTERAPWYVVPADHPSVRDAAVLEVLIATLEDMDPRYPPPDEDLAGVEVE